MGAASGKAASGSERDGDNSSSSNMAIMINAEAAASSSGSAAEWVPGWLHSLLPCSYVSDMVAELYRRVKLEVIVEVGTWDVGGEGRRQGPAAAAAAHCSASTTTPCLSAAVALASTTRLQEAR